MALLWSVEAENTQVEFPLTFKIQKRLDHNEAGLLHPANLADQHVDQFGAFRQLLRLGTVHSGKVDLRAAFVRQMLLLLSLLRGAERFAFNVVAFEDQHLIP